MLASEYLEINPWHLIGLYLICPVLLVIVIIDISFMNTAILSALPDRPDEWVLWVVVFILPHIISSFITMADSENVKTYGSKLRLAMVVLVIASIFINGVIPSFLSGSNLYQFQLAFFAIFGFSTIFHVLSQQFGICLILGRIRPTSNFNYFKWSAVILSFLLYMVVFSSEQLSALNDSGDIVRECSFLLIITLLLLVFYFGLKVFVTSKTKVGGIYIALNVFMLVSVSMFIVMEYYIFALIIPRIIHDISAFIFYSNHDDNKFRYKENNYIYLLIKNIPLSVRVVSPILGVAIAYVINMISAWVLLYLIIVLEFLHYYIESFIWKTGGNHRKYLKIKFSV